VLLQLANRAEMSVPHWACNTLAIELAAKATTCRKLARPGRCLFAGLVDKRRHHLGRAERYRAPRPKRSLKRIANDHGPGRPVQRPLEASFAIGTNRRLLSHRDKPRPSSRSPTVSIGSGRKATNWHRDRIVSSCLAACADQDQHERGGGSSNVLQQASLLPRSDYRHHR